MSQYAMLKCVTCVMEGEKSAVYPGASRTTLMVATEWYDEQGQHHYHDPNRTTTDYRCSRGHAWAKEERARCPTCGENW